MTTAALKVTILVLRSDRFNIMEHNLKNNSLNLYLVLDFEIEMTLEIDFII